MECNVGKTDRIVRAVIGLVLLGLAGYSYAMQPILAGILLYVDAIIGLILLVTAAISFCPLYKALGMSTCKK